MAQVYTWALAGCSVGRSLARSHNRSTARSRDAATFAARAWTGPLMCRSVTCALCTVAHRKRCDTWRHARIDSGSSIHREASTSTAINYAVCICSRLEQIHQRHRGCRCYLPHRQQKDVQKHSGVWQIWRMAIAVGATIDHACDGFNLLEPVSSACLHRLWLEAPSGM